MPMTEEEIDALLRQPRVATLATERDRGGAQVTPVWYEYHGNRFLIVTGKASAKVRHIQREPRVCLCVEDRNWPYKAVVLYGRAFLSEERVRETVLQGCRHYLPEEEAVALAETILQQPQVVINIVPDRVVSWDYSHDLS